MTSKPKSISQRFRRLQEIGCIASRIRMHCYAAPDIHHLVEGNKRLGDEYTIPLTPWHHRGVLPDNCRTATEAERRYGPSLARNKAAFVEAFGTERELLEFTNLVIETLWGDTAA